MVFVLGIWYLRKADREFDPLAAKAVDAADRSTDAARPAALRARADAPRDGGAKR